MEGLIFGLSGLRIRGTVLVSPVLYMALPFDPAPGSRDPRALAILAKTIYRELRSSGYGDREVMSLASELLGLVASEVKDRRESAKD